LDLEGAAVIPGQSQGVGHDAAVAAGGAGSHGKRPVLPLLSRRGAAAAGACRQQQELGLQEGSAAAAAAAAGGNCSGEEAIEDGSSDDGDEQQQQQQVAMEGTGYRGAVPTLGRWVRWVQAAAGIATGGSDSFVYAVTG
jgi:hypothetical protein